MSFFQYPVGFPKQEFNEKLEEIIREDPFEIKEKDLQDFIYDTLEKKGTCTVENLARIFITWPKFIEQAMNFKGYLRVHKFNEGWKYISSGRIADNQKSL